jgi:uncharacterized phage-associated protein
MSNVPKHTPSALDVAEYILERCGPLEPIKLQKLVYYCQAWCLAWHGKPLFSEKIQAWVHGPVVAELYQMHAHQSEVLAVGGHTERLDESDRGVVHEVLQYYAEADGKTLRELSHGEEPWRTARGDLPENMPSTEEISLESMRAFYRGRPCGLASVVTDLSCCSADRVRQSRKELDAKSWVSIEDLAQGLALAGKN